MKKNCTFFVHFVVSKVGVVVVEDTGNLLLTVTGISQVQHCPDHNSQMMNLLNGERINRFLRHFYDEQQQK